MSNERRVSGMWIILLVVGVVWATTALLTIAERALHVLASIAFTAVIAAALVAVLAKLLVGAGRPDEQEDR
jgi:hypothetical protein